VPPLDLQCDPIRGLKLKGLGIAPHSSHEARIPSTEPYDRWDGQGPDPHFGIAPDLEFCLREGDPAPEGGMSLGAALREFQCSSELVAAGVAAVEPVAVLRYSDLRFLENDAYTPLGISVTGSPNAEDIRCSALLDDPGVSDAKLESIVRSIGLNPIDPTDLEGRLGLLGESYARFGGSLRGFAAAGWYRYSGHPANVALRPDGEALLVDLDSCRAASAVGGDRAALEEVRDGMSALYNLACSFFRYPVRESVSDEVLIEAEPFSAFLDGWDPASAGSNALIGGAIARYVVSSRMRLRHFRKFLDAKEPESVHLYRFVRHDRDLTFSWFYRIAFERRLARPHAYEMPFGLPDLDDRLLRFGGRPRFELLQGLTGGSSPGCGSEGQP
jgi:hypothetical protein